jgi:hypothetical protein
MEERPMSTHQGKDGEILMHSPEDDVAVAITDIAADQEALGIVLHDGSPIRVRTLEPIPFGHKVAVRAVAAGEGVRRYGVVIGRAQQPIAEGAHVHVHNLKSTRF